MLALSFSATMNGSKPLVSIQPEELKFQFELEKQTYCDLKVSNTTDNHVAFKVKTTSPKKYFVRPNTGVIHPWDSCIIRVTLQAQREYPPDMITRDKFLLQSTIVPPNTDTDTLPSNTFTKESGRVLEEHKLRVVYHSPNSAQEDDDSKKSAKQSSDEFAQGSDIHDQDQALRHLKEQRDAAVQLTQQLRQELEMLRRCRQRKGDSGFSLTFSALVALIGLMFGFFLKLSLSSPSSTV